VEPKKFYKKKPKNQRRWAMGKVRGFTKPKNLKR
jgi:hypothetical protein